ncbi:hypothetical protein FK220_018900 [Flavobacteriaceae bacterium TP-CH-4]|uniref:Uncharacterized protein n=1 Tax=Pelagihabitans pacificus TaxID=2696054 RepID=A0A967E8M1_9FLAO|nr:hypothetical protein [Pelagihabitans pacificus]NHF61429.1 hypothetical protein [Pelagihabitans pacificus]
MIEHLPLWITLLFLLTLGATVWLFYLANGKRRMFAGFIVLWSFAQGMLAYVGFYQETDTTPPRFALVLLPVTLLLIYGMLPKQRNWIFTHRNTQISTFLHTIRVPVEIVLWQLYLYGAIPELMTFEGRNFDILAGLTAPVVGYFYGTDRQSKKGLLWWNVAGLALVSFILFNGILSAELPFQQFAFDQPNRGITFFPFVLLPATIVPLVIYTHLTDILKLRREIRNERDD